MWQPRPTRREMNVVSLRGVNQPFDRLRTLQYSIFNHMMFPAPVSEEALEEIMCKIT